jgi:hypothetical protein
LELLEKLIQMPSTLVQEGERSWSLYVAAEGSEVPSVVYGLGIDPNRISIFDGGPHGVTVLERLPETVSD